METNLLLIAWLVSVLYGSIALFRFAIHPHLFSFDDPAGQRELAKRFGEEFHNYKKTVPLVLSFFSSLPAQQTPGLMGSSREV